MCFVSGILALTAVTSFAQGTAMQEEIEHHRTGVLTIHTRPGAQVQVNQTRHEFWFGAAISSGIFGGRADQADKEKYVQIFQENFNSGVFENALKWHSMEHRQGEINYAVVDSILEWADKHDIPVRGHCIFWGIKGRVQDWQKELDDDALRQVVENHGRKLAARYRGRIPEYDLNNEMIHGNYYEEHLGPDITKDMAKWVKESDPDTVLFVNDYDVLTGNRLQDYVVHIQGLLDQGALIGGIGVQGHLHADDFDPEQLKHALDTLEQFKLPIRVTEFNFPGQRSKYHKDRSMQMTQEEEARKAEAIQEYFRICFAHPAVEGILLWGFWEGANWIPQSSLWKRDWTPTPAAKVYRDMVFGDWWTKWEGKADDKGLCEVRVFYGQHQVMVDGQEFSVKLSKTEGSKTLELQD
ncbi:endo-1,4-beta-xylanase [Candidatus Poribacteria bacterium]